VENFKNLKTFLKHPKTKNKKGKKTCKETLNEKYQKTDYS